MAAIARYAANMGTVAASAASTAGQRGGARCGAEPLWRGAPAWWDGLEVRDAVRSLGDHLAALSLKGVGR